MQFANIPKAVDYINVLTYGNKYSRFVSGFQLKTSRKGLIGFNVYKTRFPTRDTIGALKTLLTTRLGRPPDVIYSDEKVKGYSWTIEAPTRQLHIEYRKGVGTFIQLTDTGN